MNTPLTYDDFRERIDIQDVLRDAGYHINRRDGLRWPSYVRVDSDGRRVHGDKFIVTANGKGCFHPPEMKVYSVVSFIVNHPDLFQEYRPGMNPHHLVNLVCNRLLNQPIDPSMRNIIEPDGSPGLSASRTISSPTFRSSTPRTCASLHRSSTAV